MDFDDMHSELETCWETRVGLRLKIENLGSTGKKDEDAMDVGVLSTGKPKGKGKGKHLGSFNKGKGKGSKGKGKGERKVRAKDIIPLAKVDQARQPWFAQLQEAGAFPGRLQTT